MTRDISKLSVCFGAICAALLLAPAAYAQQKSFNLPEQEATRSIPEFARQAGIQISAPTEALKGMRTPPVQGEMDVQMALKQLLSGTGLTVMSNENGMVVLGKPAQSSHAAQPADLRLVTVSDEGFRFGAQRMQQAGNSSRPGGARTPGADTHEGSAARKAGDEENARGIPEILVKGKRSLNTDIQRTEDDIQPYVVFGSREIARSQAVNLEEFLRTRLPMNTASSNYGQTNGINRTSGGSYTFSSINLRGLGENQTLVLVDGRRLPGIAFDNNSNQPDLNGIPLASIERIEVLPSTAGGIYGGSATGGVINIVLRRDFRGLQIDATYANTFDTDTANMRLDANAGFSLEGGRTQVTIAATRSEANNLVIGDRDFAARGIALQLANNPGAITGALPLGGTVNISSAEQYSYIPVPAGTPGSFGVGIGFFIPGLTSAPTTAENPNILFVGTVRTPLTLKDGTPLNSLITHIPLGYAGPSSDGGAALLANAGQYNLDMPGGMLGRERGLLAAPSMESVSLNLRREFGARVDAFLDLSRNLNKGSSFSGNVPDLVTLSASAPNNPFQQAINVRIPTPGLRFEHRSESETLRGTGGFVVRMPRDWTGGVDYGWSRSRFRSSNSSTLSVLDSVGRCVLERGVAANVDPDGAGPLTPCAAGNPRPALNALQEGNATPIDFSPYLLPSPNFFRGPYDSLLKEATVRLSGPVMTLPGGPLSLSASIRRREQDMQEGFVQYINANTLDWTYVFYPQRSQDATSFYAEARAPLISPGNARPFARELELQVSVRRDDYETRGNTSPSLLVPSRNGPFPEMNYVVGRLASTDYTAGLRFAPLQDLAFRVSFGTGFLPPSVTQVAPSENSVSYSVGSDSKRGNTNIYRGVPYTVIDGGRPDLNPEQSESWSAGLIFKPRFAPGFRLSADYTRIEKVDEIQYAGASFLIDNEEIFQDRIVRGANLPEDLPGWAGPITSIDLTLINIARTELEAYDIQADYTLETDRFGSFHAYAIATWQPHYRNQVLPTSPVVDSVGFAAGLTNAPLEWRGNIGLDWDKDALTLSWNAQYYNSYFGYSADASDLSIASFVQNQGSAKIPSQMYHDLIATWRFNNVAGFAGGILANSELSFGIQNLFNTYPPILASFDPIAAGYSSYGDPRLRRYTLSIRKSFGN